MLKYLYSNCNTVTPHTILTEQKILNNVYFNKFYIRSSIVETKDFLILDDNYNFFLINKINIEKQLAFYKENSLLGKSLQLKEFLYSKKNYFKIKFYIGNRVYNNYISYLKILFILKTTIKVNINAVWPLLIVNRGHFSFVFNGLKGFLPRKNFGKLRKIFKKVKNTLFLKQKFLILLKQSKKIILRTLLLKNFKSNHLFIIKHRYKNQIRIKSPFITSTSSFKNKKLFTKNLK